jgi:cell division transport system permease protein
MSLGTDLRRIIRSGLISFWRGGLVSTSSVLVMTLALLVVGFVILSQALVGYTRSHIESRVDVTISFYPQASEAQVLEVQDSIEGLATVAEVTYTSRADALAEFKARHANDYLVLQALDELGSNPLGATLDIRAKDASSYENIVDQLSGDALLTPGSRSVIEKVNYYQNRELIQRLTGVGRSLAQIGLTLAFIFIGAALLMTFHTVRLAVYGSREEIKVMRLVGADDRYIQGPFIIMGMVAGVGSGVLAFILLYPISLWLTRTTQTFFGGFSILRYYVDNIPQLFFALIATGLAVGLVSSLLAVQRYLKS